MVTFEMMNDIKKNMTFTELRHILIITDADVLLDSLHLMLQRYYERSPIDASTAGAALSTLTHFSQFDYRYE